MCDEKSEIAVAPFAGYAPDTVGRWAGTLSGTVRGSRPAAGADGQLAGKGGARPVQGDVEQTDADRLREQEEAEHEGDHRDQTEGGQPEPLQNPTRFPPFSPTPDSVRPETQMLLQAVRIVPPLGSREGRMRERQVAKDAKSRNKGAIDAREIPTSGQNKS